MVLPPWFQQAIQKRLDHLANQFEHHPELKPYREEERAAYQAMVAGIGNRPTPAFMEWEDKAHLVRAMENERMYLQGMRDGMQLITEMLIDSPPTDEVISAASMSVSGKSQSPNRQ